LIVEALRFPICFQTLMMLRMESASRWICSAFSGFAAVLGSDQKDRLTGARGQQWFVPRGGADVVHGGRGQDVITYFLSAQMVEVNLSEGEAQGEGRDHLAGLEVVFGSEHDDSLIGSRRYEWLFGDEGDDHLDGGGGRDVLEGGPGTLDVCVGGLIYVGCENQGAQFVGGTPPDADTSAGLAVQASLAPAPPPVSETRP
jgi:hypothetical protein